MKQKIDSKYLTGLFKFFSPIFLGLGVIGTVGFLMEQSLRIKYFPLITAYFFPPLGKESVIPAGVLAGIHPLVIALSIAFVDIIVALFLVWNYDYAKKIPIIGKFMEKIERVGRKSSDKYSWVKALRFVGIVLFVMVPFQGSGGLVGSIIGRLIGMKPWNTVIAISTGSIIGCTLIAYFADTIIELFEENFLQGIPIIIVIIVIGIMFYFYKKNPKKIIRK